VDTFEDLCQSLACRPWTPPGPFQRTIQTSDDDSC